PPHPKRVPSFSHHLLRVSVVQPPPLPRPTPFPYTTLFRSVWRKSVERYSSNLIEKSNLMYDELLEKEIIPAIERENEEELSVKEIETIVEKLDDSIDTYTKKIDDSDVVSERKQLRSERK